MHHQDQRTAIVAACRDMAATGLTHGTSGNISLRVGDRMLITPSGVAYDTMTPDAIVEMGITATDVPGGTDAAGFRPSVEFPFHRAILAHRPDVGAVVHTHSRYATILAILRKRIPPLHYMIAAFGGDDIRCADYAMFGSDALSENALAALSGRNGCLLANHGAITVAPTLPKAMALARELEELACQFVHTMTIGGGPVLLSDSQIAEALEGFASYGQSQS